MEMNFQCLNVIVARRTAPSLDVAGLPGFDRLTEAEVEVC